MRFWTIAVLLAASLVGSQPFVLASDGDSLTQRQQILSPCTPDATCVLNAIINKHFEHALEKVNRKLNPTRLDLERALLNEVGDKKVLGITFPVGSLEKPIEKGYSDILEVNGKPVCIPSFTIERSKSIYADAKLLESPGVVLGMAAHFKMCDLVIGSDKLTHFFAQGYEYIEVQRERGIAAAVQHGIETEKGKYGLAGNGIYSYGDLSANFCGLCFWMQLTDPNGGYFAKCNGNWVQTQQFCWQRYVNAAWDEGINPPCGPAVNRTQPYIAKLVCYGKIPHCPPLHTEKVPCVQEFYPQWVLPHVLNPKTLAFLESNVGEEEFTSQPEIELE